MTFRILVACFALAVGLAGALPATAQIQNGDFEAGGAYWTVEPLPEGWSVDFQLNGGLPDGSVVIRSPADGTPGEACIRQHFECGSPSGQTLCEVPFSVMFTSPDGDPNLAYFSLYFDGAWYAIASARHFGAPHWYSSRFTLPCGTHEVAFCLRTTQGSGVWSARYDNLGAACLVQPVPALPTSWGSVKIRYR